MAGELKIKLLGFCWFGFCFLTLAEQKRAGREERMNTTERLFQPLYPGKTKGCRKLAAPTWSETC